MTQIEAIETHRYRTYLMVLGIIITVGLVPLLLYRLFCGQVTMITPTEAKKMLRMPNSSAILVDIGSREKFNSIHIDGAQNWTIAEILAINSIDEVPKQFRDKTLLLICNVGISSTFAARHLISIGLEKAMNVRGGIQEWIASTTGPKGDVFDRWIEESGDTDEFPFRKLSWYEQVLMVIGAFPIKISYTLLSLIVAIILWRSKSPELAALRWAMIFFFVGENCCAINYYVFKNTSYLSEYLHGFGMLLSFGFVTYALFEGMDRRILMLSEPEHRCAAMGLCKRCIKYEDVPCNLRRTFFVIIPALIIIAFMPLCADWDDTSYNTMIFGTFFNFSHPMVSQIYEKVYCPIAATVLLAISLIILIFKKNNPLPLSKIFFAAGTGPLGFGLFRSILVNIYRQNLMWFNLWEESTELLFIAGVCFVLWVFRRGLFEKSLT